MKKIIIILSLIASTVYADVSRKKIIEKQVELVDLMARTYVSEKNGCEFSKSEIYEQLERAYYYADSKDDVKITPAIESTLSDILAFKVISTTNNQSYDVEYLKTVLPGVKMYGPAPGAYGHESLITFLSSSKISYGYLMFVGDVAKWETVIYDYSFIKTKQGRMILFYDTVEGGVELELKIPSLLNEYQKNWHLLPVGSEDSANPYFDGYVDFPDECSA